MQFSVKDITLTPEAFALFQDLLTVKDEDTLAAAGDAAFGIPVKICALQAGLIGETLQAALIFPVENTPAIAEYGGLLAEFNVKEIHKVADAGFLRQELIMVTVQQP